jgi:hypothetical protein
LIRYVKLEQQGKRAFALCVREAGKGKEKEKITKGENLNQEEWEKVIRIYRQRSARKEKKLGE